MRPHIFLHMRNAWAWGLPWLLSASSLIVSKLTGYAIVNTHTALNYDYWFTYTLSLIYMVKPWAAVASGIPLTAFYPEYWLTLPLAFLAKALTLGVDGYVEATIVFNVVFTAMALITLAKESGKPWWVGLLAYAASAPGLVTMMLGVERGLMVGFTALALVVLSKVEDKGKAAYAGLALFSVAYAFLFPYTVFFTTLLLTGIVIFTLTLQRKLNKAALLMLIILITVGALRIMILSQNPHPVNMLTAPVAWADRWSFSISKPSGLWLLQLPGEYSPSSLFGYTYIMLASLFTLLFLITNIDGLLDPTALTLLLLILLLPYPYTLASIAQFTHLTSLLAYHTLLRFHGFLPLLILLLYGSNAKTLRTQLPLLGIITILSVAAVALVPSVTPINTPLNELSNHVPLPNGTLINSPEAAFTELNPPTWLRLYYPPTAPYPYPRNWTLFISLMRLYGASQFIIVHPNATYTVIRINDSCPILRTAPTVAFTGTELYGNLTNCPIPIIPMSVVTQGPVADLITQYALTHSDSQRLIGVGVVGGVLPLLCPPLINMSRIVSRICTTAVEQDASVTVNYPINVTSTPKALAEESMNAAPVVWGTLPSTPPPHASTYPDSSLITLYSIYNIINAVTLLLMVTAAWWLTRST